jgi:hypothetical protein
VSDTETYAEYGVFVWYGSAEVLYRTFKQARMVGIWRRAISDDEVAKISSVRARRVSIQRGEWALTEFTLRPHELRGTNRPADTPRGGDRDAQGMGLVNSGRQSTGDSADPCKYCGIVGSHTSDCPVVS